MNNRSTAHSNIKIKISILDYVYLFDLLKALIVTALNLLGVNATVHQFKTNTKQKYFFDIIIECQKIRISKVVP